MRRKSAVLICLIIGLLILSFSVARSQQEGVEAIPLTFGFYGAPQTSAALGMEVAIDEMNNSGPVTGADGVPYQIQALVTEDLAQLQNAAVILALPRAEPQLEEPLTLEQPVILLSSEAELALPDVGATIFRGMTDERIMYQGLADFAVRFNNLQSLVMIGDTEVYGDSFTEFSTAISLASPDREIAVITISANLPTLEQINEAIAANPQVIVYRGAPDNAGAVLDVLSSTGWTGVFFYDHAYEAAQLGVLSTRTGIQVVGMTPWSNGNTAPLSLLFRQAYVSRTGKVPDAQAAAAYDVTWALRLLVERVGGDPASLTRELPNTDDITTTQGTIAPAAYGGTDLFQSVSIYQLHPLGGMQVLANYDAGVLVIEDQDVAGLPTTAPLPSATPTGPVVVVTATTLNVRSGPGYNYARIGQLRQGDTVAVVGSIPDYSWFYVQASNGLGWVTAEFVQLFNPLGGVNGITMVPIPPTPTIGATFTPESPADLVIDSVTLSPARPVNGQAFTASIVVRNAGGTDVGQFTVSANWQPGNIATQANVPFLGVFESTTVLLQAVVNGSGAQSTSVVIDSGAAVTESNESNNSFAVNYVVDAAPTVNTTVTVGPAQHNWAGTLPDFDWTGAAPINALNGATLGIISGINYENVTTSDLTASKITGANIPSVPAGTVFGLRTGEGHCGVFRIENVVGSSITFSYRMYAIADCAG